MIPDQQVTESVSALSQSGQHHYQLVVQLLAENPFPSPKFGDIEEFVGADGRIFYEFFDGIIPLVLQYRVYTPDVESGNGLVWVARAIHEADL